MWILHSWGLQKVWFKFRQVKPQLEITIYSPAANRAVSDCKVYVYGTDRQNQFCMVFSTVALCLHRGGRTSANQDQRILWA